MTATATPTDLEAGAFVDVDGVRTHYHDVGDGPPVLLLHGSGPGVSSWTNWRLVLPVLAEHHRVIAMDQVGFGRTSAPVGTAYDRSTWTRHADRFMQTLGVDRYDVIGNSMGGAIALSLASARPEALRRIVVMGTMGLAMTLPPGLDEVWGYEPSREGMRRLIDLFAYDSSIATDELVESRYQASLDPAARTSWEAMFTTPRQQWVDDLALSREELTALPHPVLLVHGRDDQVIPFASSSLPLLDVLTDVGLHVFGGCGHWVMIEKTQPFNRLVADFLA